MNEIIASQIEMCARHSANYVHAALSKIVALSYNFDADLVPINCLRHPPSEDATGWYIWSGEYSDSPNYFKPIHGAHLEQYCPQVIKYLGLAPGWRFLLAGDYEDVWEDKALLDV